MLTYNILANIIKSIEKNIQEGNHRQAVKNINLLKNYFLNFLENFYNILKNIQDKKISFEEYKILFQIVSELYLDLDGLYRDCDVYLNNGAIQKRESRLSISLKKLGLLEEIKWFDLANDIIGNIYDFMEFYYEARKETTKYCLSISEIKDKINLLKSINKNVHSSR